MTTKYDGHTPGPWEADEEHVSAAGESPAAGAAVCRAYTHDDFPCRDEGDRGPDDNEGLANALLIADAPALLAAALELRGRIAEAMGDDLAEEKLIPEWERVRAAIARLDALVKEKP